MKKPELTVSAVIFNNREEILLCRSHKWEDKFVIPGGHVEYGEKLEEALQREILEETSLKIHDIKLFGIKECLYSNGYYKDRHFLFMDYTCKTHETEVVLNEEAQEYIWIKLSEMDRWPLGGFTESLLKKLLPHDSPEERKCIYYNYS